MVTHFRVPANRNGNCTASQLPELLPAFCLLPWKPYGRIQTWRGSASVRLVGASARSALLHCFLPYSWECGPVLRHRPRCAQPREQPSGLESFLDLPTRCVAVAVLVATSLGSCLPKRSQKRAQACGGGGWGRLSALSPSGRGPRAPFTPLLCALVK